MMMENSEPKMSSYLKKVVDGCIEDISNIQSIPNAVSVLEKIQVKLENIVESIDNASVSDWTLDVSTSFYEFFKEFVKSFISMTDTLIGSGKDDELSGFSSIVDELETDYDCTHQKLTNRIFDVNDEDAVSVLWDERKEEDKKKCLKVYEELCKSVEDLRKYLKKKTEVSEESSAAVLGSMLPQTPVSGVIKKGGTTMHIPDTLVEFVYNPEMKHDLMVESAFNKFANEISTKHGNEVSTNYLPGKVRKLTIERAMLRVKIQWIRLLPCKDKEAKLKTYKTRLVEVEKALRKISSSISNVADKKKMDEEIKKIDASVTKETKRRIRNKQITESVNALITEYKEAGLVPECMELIEESFFDDDVYTEGVNMDLETLCWDTKKKVKPLMKDARKKIREENFKEAKVSLTKAKSYMEKLYTEIKKFPTEDLSSSICGFLLGSLLDFCKWTLPCLLIGSVIGGASIAIGIRGGAAYAGAMAAASVGDTAIRATKIGQCVVQIRGIINNVSDMIKRRGGIDVGLINSSFRRCIDYYGTTIYTIDTLIKRCNELEKEKKDEMKKESVRDSDIVLFDGIDEDFINECVASLESDDIYTEGVNIDLEKKKREIRKKVKPLIKDAKQNIKAERYKEAKVSLEKAKGYLDKLYKEIKSYPTEKVSATICGNFLGGLLEFCKCILPCMLVGAVIGAGTGMATAAVSGPAVAAITAPFAATIAGSVASIPVCIVQLRGIINNISDMLKRRGADIGIVNTNFRRCIDYYETTLHIVDRLIKRCDELEKEKNDDTKTESVITLSENAEFMKECATLVNEGVLDIEDYVDFVTEAKKPDDGIMDILKMLNAKGYKTKYSCTGHKKTWARDRNDDGIINGELVSSARIVFKKDYNFPDAPKHWGWKNVDGKDYLYVLPKSCSGTTEQNQKAFDAWKNKYMESLRTWVENLPDLKDSGKVIRKDNPSKEEDVSESTAFESVDFTPMNDYRSIDDMIQDELSMLAFECETGPNPMVYMDSENF